MRIIFACIVITYSLVVSNLGTKDSMKGIKKIGMLYFQPNSFEYNGDKTIYELLGIKIYKKYLPTTGDIVRRWRNIKQINTKNTNRIEALYNYERQTRNYEWRHIFGVILFVVLALLIDKKLTPVDWAILISINMCVNIYPIFLQRHNRIRLIKVLTLGGQPSPYEKRVIQKPE